MEEPPGRFLSDSPTAEFTSSPEAHHLLRLAEATRVFIEADPDLTTLLKTIAQHVARTLSDTCTIRLLSTDRRTLLPGHTHHDNPTKQRALDALLAHPPQHISAGPLGQVAESGQALLLPVLTLDLLRSIAAKPRARNPGVHSCAIVPLRAKRGGPTGVLCCMRESTTPPYDADDIVLLQEIADRAALALDHALRYEEARNELAERQRIEAALRASESRYRAMIEEAADAIFIADGGGRYVEVNEQACTLTGYSRRELLARSVTDVIVPDPLLPASSFPILRAGHSVRQERLLRRRDGTLVQVDAAGRMLADGRFLAMVRDISERSRAEEAIRASASRLAGIIDSAMDAIITIDSVQRIVAFNRTAELIFGCPAAAAVGEPLDRFIPARFRVYHAAHIVAFGQTGVTNRAMGDLRPLIGLRANGEEFPIEATISQVAMPDGRLYTVILRDVTERHRAEAEREALLASERASRRAAEEGVRARAEFLAMASHEFKTPITTLTGSVELLERQLTRPNPDAASIARQLGRIQNQARRLLDLVGQLLDLSRAQEKQLRRVRADLTDLLRRVVERFGTNIDPAHHTIALEAPAALFGNWDMPRLDQVLTNLIGNAVKYSPAGGLVKVRLRQVNDRAEIVVIDQGIGIPLAEQATIFEPFVRGSSAIGIADGTGLGLPIAAMLVSQHGGNLTVLSEPGRGSAFTVLLPLDVEDTSGGVTGPTLIAAHGE